MPFGDSAVVPSALALSRRQQVLGLLLVLVPLFIPARVLARVWYVRADSTGDAPTIQAAVDSARAGDEVLLAPGLFRWSAHAADSTDMIIMKSGITLRSESGPEATTLDGEARGRIVFCRDVGQIRIEGLTIQHGYGPLASAELLGGGGICSVGNSQPAIANCIIRENRSSHGGGILLLAGGTISNCQILDNVAFDGAGGVYCRNATVSNCTLRGNSTGGEGSTGGALSIFAGRITDCWFEENWVNGFFGAAAGAVEAWEGLAIEGSVFLRNKVYSGTGNGVGAAIAVRLGGTCTLSHCIFANNQIRIGQASSGGGAVHATDGASLEIIGCTFIDNSTQGMFSTPVISVSSRGRGTVRSSLIVGNRGGIPCYGPALEFSCTNLYDNDGGNAICGTDLGGNFSADPQFCAVNPLVSLNFSLQEDSPCAPGNHPGGACELIGAQPVGCGAVATRAMSWSELKSMYRR